MSTTVRGLALADAIASGEVDIPAAGTAVQLVAAETKCIGVIVGNPNASNAIYVGDSTVDKTNARGIKILAGESVLVPVADASLLWVDGTSNGDDAGYIILK